jgi:hypothetical protein
MARGFGGRLALPAHKEGRALRTETTINNTWDFRIGKRLHNLPKLRRSDFRPTGACSRWSDRVTTTGLRAALFCTRSYTRILRPGLALGLPGHRAIETPLKRAFEIFEKEGTVDSIAA